MQCPQCGHHVQTNAKFCSECGTRLSDVTQPGDLTARDINATNVVVGTQVIQQPQGRDPASLRRAYLLEMAREANRLPWATVTKDYGNPERGEGLGLAEVYTHLDSTELERVACEEDLRRFLAEMERGEVRRVPVQTILDQKDRLLILGDPGSGKSTFVKYLAYTLAQASLTSDAASWLSRMEPWSHDALLPVFVELRSLAAWLEAGAPRLANTGLLLGYVRSMLAAWQMEDFWPVLDKAIREGKEKLILLLDGLDEVPATLRPRVTGAVQAFADRYRQHRYVVTCRPYAYVGQPDQLRAFAEINLAPFDAEQAANFISTWYRELTRQGRFSKQQADERTGQLQQAIRGRDLWGLAQRPLLLTVMTLLHTFRGQLPEDRTELYADAVDLLLRRWEQRIGGEAGLLEQLDVPGLKISDLEAGLYEVAFRAHGGMADVAGTADVAEADLRQWLAPYLGGSWDKAGDFVRYIRERAGLLVRHKTDAYTFPHRTFQEFMAACHLVGVEDYPAEAARRAITDLTRWREAFVLAAGHAARTHRLGHAIASVNALCPEDVSAVSQPAAPACQQAQLAGEALLEIGLVGVGRERAGQAALKRVRHWLMAAMRAATVLQPRERAEAGNLLARLGDPRFRADFWHLPDEPLLGFVEIPAGPFVMGTRKEDIPALMKQFRADREWYERETPQHKRALPRYYIARYPLTVAQFRAFVRASGHKPRDPDSLQGIDTHPVVNVTWHDAMAYCEWLTQALRARDDTPEPLGTLLREEGWAIILPGEAQWEKAARGPVLSTAEGTDERTFPWGEKIDANRANYADTGLSTTSAVGCFPGGASPYGIEELSGNVLEWCSTEWQESYANYQVDMTMRSAAVLRGGAFDNFTRYVRCASRLRYNPYYRLDDFGFRVACAVPHPR